LRYWFTGCPHFGHDNIRIYVNRPFKSLDEMNSTLIRNWNSRVKEDDIVFVVGDFCFRNTPNMVHKGEGTVHPAEYYDEKLNGKKIYIKGNHDGNNSCKTCIRNIKIKLGGYIINIVHNPFFASYNCDFNIVSHVHNLWKSKVLTSGKKSITAINVGVDVWNFMPVSIEEINKEYSRCKKLNKEINAKQS
jgi:calcineurin-like phosphoesterase family protein